LEGWIIYTFGFPDTNPAKNYGFFKGWSIGINDNFINLNIEDPIKYPYENAFTLSKVRPIGPMPGYVSNQSMTLKRMYGLNPPPEAFDPNSKESMQRKSTYENIFPHTTFEFPFVVYWDAAIARRLSDLGSVLNDYAEIQFAQFVTGARPISEIDRYFTELDSMGYQEYLKYYVDYYEGVKARR